MFCHENCYYFVVSWTSYENFYWVWQRWLTDVGCDLVLFQLQLLFEELILRMVSKLCECVSTTSTCANQTPCINSIPRLHPFRSFHQIELLSRTRTRVVLNHSSACSMLMRRCISLGALQYCWAVMSAPEFIGNNFFRRARERESASLPGVVGVPRFYRLRGMKTTNRKQGQLLTRQRVYFCFTTCCGRKTKIYIAT